MAAQQAAASNDAVSLFKPLRAPGAAFDRATASGYQWKNATETYDIIVIGAGNAG